MSGPKTFVDGEAYWKERALAAERARDEARSALKGVAEEDNRGELCWCVRDGWAQHSAACARARAVLEGGGRPPTEAPKCPECEGTGVVRDDLTAVVCSRCCGSGLRNG